jgi:6-hydroxycyclohex-1-ene-1-carbonyl-CoA dehydrogenase
MVGPGALRPFEDRLPAPEAGWVDVEVLGCGVCHTDVGFLYGGVATARPGVVLGHEIVGRTIPDGRLVIVPAVSPCGECVACRRGRRTACAAGLMPGNHHDGGFATLAQVPSRWLCPVPAVPDGIEPWQLAVVADAVTTPLQAIVRAGLRAGEVAVVVGAGGVGGFLIELAAARGAHAVAVDVAPIARERAIARGALFAVAAGEPRATRQELARELALRGLALDGARIFECSGAPAGQALAFALVTRGGSLSVIGFTPEAVPLRLSNLMALDAEAYGNWGCDPVLYGEALALVARGAVDLAGAVEKFPLSDAPSVLAAAHRHELARRAVLVPDARP